MPLVYCFLFPCTHFPYCKSNAFMFVIYFELHTTGSCPESTDQPPAVTALSAVLVAVVLLLAVTSFTTILFYISEYDVN